MNITLSVDEQVARRAREAAQKMGKSLNQVVRDYLEQLAGGARRGQQWSQFEERCLNSRPSSKVGSSIATKLTSAKHGHSQLYRYECLGVRRSQ